jgi:hypothetical protein
VVVGARRWPVSQCAGRTPVEAPRCTIKAVGELVSADRYKLATFAEAEWSPSGWHVVIAHGTSNIETIPVADSCP